MIIKFNDLPKIRKKHQRQKIVFVGGTFDLLHYGHLYFFKHVKKFGDILIVAVSTDIRVRQRKGEKRPICSETERCLMVSALKDVDYSLIAPQPRKNLSKPTMRILAKLKPDFFATTDKKWVHWRKDMEVLGVNLKLPARSKHTSTTRIINKILKRYHK